VSFDDARPAREWVDEDEIGGDGEREGVEVFLKRKVCLGTSRGKEDDEEANGKRLTSPESGREEEAVGVTEVRSDYWWVTGDGSNDGDDTDDTEEGKKAEGKEDESSVQARAKRDASKKIATKASGRGLFFPRSEG
jgi:hypothetical protein